jgi:hypothetical protein
VTVTISTRQLRNGGESFYSDPDIKAMWSDVCGDTIRAIIEGPAQGARRWGMAERRRGSVPHRRAVSRRTARPTTCRAPQTI